MLKKIFLFFLVITSHVCFSQKTTHYDTIPIVSSVRELEDCSDNKVIMLRTYDIRFQFVYRHLDTTKRQTCMVLDSIASYLIAEVSNIKSVIINVHLSLAEWDEYYSASNLLYMCDDIVSYLASKGVDTTVITTKQRYNYFPLINCFDMNGDKREDCFENYDFRINRRVEFVIEKWK